MKIAEKGGYKRMCYKLFAIGLWVIFGLAIIIVFHEGLQGSLEFFLFAISLLIFIWISMSIFYGLFFLITKPLQKKHGVELEVKKITRKPSEVLCKGCGKPLGQAQIDYMLGNPQYQEWCRAGFCGFACFEKRKDT
ncbi:hypothetical protein ACFL3Q_15550 [Planctomycetota bacterium]